MEMDEIQKRDYLYIVKSMAIVTVVCAHVATVLNESFISKVFANMLNSIGSIGVGVFLLVSGYLFYDTKKTSLQFLKRKFVSIIIPWFFCGTLLFLYVTCRKGGFNFYNWITTITVYSHLYYLTILIICYFLFWKIRKCKYCLLVMSLLSVVSIILTGYGCLPIYPYINPLNWVIYFILGLTIKQYDLLVQLVSFCKKWFIWITGGYIGLFVLYFINGSYISYWKHAAIIAEFIAIALIFGASAYGLNGKIKGMLIDVGKMSFSIYLLHTPFAGFITFTFNRYNLWYISLLRPFIVIGITILFIQSIRYIAIKVKINKQIDILLGIRT